MKSNSKNNNKKNKSFISIKSNLFVSKSMEKIKRKNFLNENVNNSSKSKNFQSFSTGTDDKKDNEIREFLSMKNLNSFNIIKNYSIKSIGNDINKTFYSFPRKDERSRNNNYNQNKFEKKIIANNNKNENMYNNINLLKIYAKLDNVTNSLNKLISKNNNYINNNYIFCSNKCKNISQNKNKIKEYNKKDKTYIEDKFKNNGSNKVENEILKPLPPKTPKLFENIYIFFENNNNKYINHDCFKKLNRSKIYNNFYNHFFIQSNERKKGNITYASFSTTCRIKRKLLTILYFCPIKKI